MTHRCDLCFGRSNELAAILVADLEEAAGLDLGLTTAQEHRYRVLVCPDCIDEYARIASCTLCGSPTSHTFTEQITDLGRDVPCCERCQEKVVRNNRYGRTGWGEL